MKKVIAIVLAFILVSSLALPTFVFAADEVAAAADTIIGDFGNHTTPEEFWDENTNEDGSIKWEGLSTNLFNISLIIKVFEGIAQAFRDAINTIFGFVANLLPDFDDDVAEDNVAGDDVVVEDESVAVEDESVAA